MHTSPARHTRHTLIARRRAVALAVLTVALVAVARLAAPAEGVSMFLPAIANALALIVGFGLVAAIGAWIAGMDGEQGA